MLKACILAFLSGIFFFFLILQSAWWLVPAVLTWTAIFVWQERQESTRGTKGTAKEGRVEAAPTKVRAKGEGIRANGEECDRGKTRDEVLPKVSRPE